MSIFGSSRSSGSIGGLLSGLFGGRNNVDPDTGSYGTSTRPGGVNRKLIGGALLAAGAAYFYNRNKNKNTTTPGFLSNR